MTQPVSYADQERRPTKYIVGVVIAVIVHVFIIWALMNGLGTEIVKQLRPPIQTKIITEPTKPPPPPPPPPPPQLMTPPPPYIPPPKLQIQPPPQKHVIKQVTHEKPPVVMPPVSPVPSAPKGPPVPDHSAGATPINGARPIFPEEMLEENREGSVTLACDIGIDGRATNCNVLKSSGGHAFVEAAMTFLRKARYRPAVANGQPVIERHHTLHIDFTLGDD